MKLIVLSLAAMAVAFAQTPATPAVPATPASPAAKVSKKHVVKHAKKSHTVKAATPAAK